MRHSVFFLYAALVSSAILFYSQDSQASCEVDRKIVFAGLDWDSNTFHVEVVRYILEKGYECDTDMIPGSSLPMIAALARGDVDIMMEVWLDNIRDAWAQFEKDDKVTLLGVNFPDSIQGFYVPRYVIEGDAKRGIKPIAPDLKHVRDLPRFASLFKDPENPSKGRFHNCILGWTCETVNTKKLQAYGLNRTYANFRPGSAAVMDAAISSAFERGEPILTYYWGPTWILGKYDMILLEEPPYDEKIWNRFLKERSPKQATAYRVSEVLIGAHKSFTTQASQTVAFLKNYRTTSQIVSEALAYTRSNEGATMKDAAIHFLKTRAQIWKTWVPLEIFEKVQAHLENEGAVASRPLLDIEKSVNEFVQWLVVQHERKFALIAAPILQLILIVEAVLTFAPWWLFITGTMLLSFLLTYRPGLPILVGACLLVIYSLGFWLLAMQTLALMLISILLSIIAGIPLGIFLSRYPRIRSFTLPMLDALQTMPSFVYLIPALMLFGLGKVPAVFATFIYAVPPLIRLTDHGIRMVDPAVIEAARAFGANRWQILLHAQLPLALKTIMTGINQTTMLGLSMVVIASMIGARGLGERVLLGIQKLNVGQGLAAGIGIVALAIVMDRLTQALGRKVDQTLGG